MTAQQRATHPREHERSVLVVEDDALLRELLAVALERHGFSVDTAASASDAKRSFSRGDHDALVLDINLGPGPNGFDLAEVLRQQAPHVAIVFLTNVPDPRFVGRAPEDVPKGVAYLRKSSLGDVDALIVALDSALRGSGIDGLRQDRDPERPLASLTRKQIAVLSLVAAGKSNAQIAEDRGVSVKAIEDTISRAAQALGIDTQEEGNLRVAAARRFLAATGGANPVSGAS